MTVRDNQRRMVANALRAGNKLTAAQKKNFTAKEIASIRSGLKKDSPSKAISVATGRASLRGRKRSGLTGVKRAGSNIGRQRGAKISGYGGSAGSRETQAKRRKYKKKGVGAGQNIKKRRGA